MVTCCKLYKPVGEHLVIVPGETVTYLINFFKFNECQPTLH